MAPVHIRIAILRDRIARLETGFAALATAGPADIGANEERCEKQLQRIWDDVLFLERMGVLQQLQALLAAESKAEAGS